MKKQSLLILSCIIIFGGFLRFYSITTDPPGLYIDEVSIALNAYDILKTGRDQYGIQFPLAFKSFGDYKMPGYIYAVSVSMALFGKNEFAVRFPSAFFGTATILILFLFFYELLSLHSKTQKLAQPCSLFAAGLLAITPWHIHFSRAGFEVTLAVFFYILGALLGVKYWRSKKILYIASASIAFALAMYTYQSYRVFVPITILFGCFLALWKKEHKKGILIGIFLIVLLACPLILFSFTQHGQARFMQTFAFVSNPYKKGVDLPVGDVLIVLKNYFSYFSFTYLFTLGDQINRNQVNDLGILYIWQLPFIIAGLYFLTKTPNKVLRTITLFLLLSGPIPASLAIPSPHSVRFLIGTIPYTMLTVLGIYQFVSLKKKWVKYFFIGIGLFAIVEFSFYIQYYYVNYPKEALLDWGGSCKEVAFDIQKDAKNYKHIVIEKNLDCVPETFYFYIPQVSFTNVPITWKKPQSWGKTLYVRTYYGNPHPDNLLYNVYLHNVNNDIFAQFFVL